MLSIGTGGKWYDDYYGFCFGYHKAGSIGDEYPNRFFKDKIFRWGVSSEYGGRL